MARSRFELPPRLVDWSILIAVGFAVATGLVTLVSGQPGDAVVFVLHGMGGLTLVVLLFWKLRRVRPRVTTRAAWNRGTFVSVVLTALALAALATGLVWTFGGTFMVGPWLLLFVHMALGVLVVPVLLVHLCGRVRLPSTDDFAGRRTALSSLAVVGFGALAWRFQREANRLLGLATDQRFTGSTEEGTDAANAFPVTSWVADDPEPIDPDDWQLWVNGAVEREHTLSIDDLEPDSERRTTLDCTSGGGRAEGFS